VIAVGEIMPEDCEIEVARVLTLLRMEQDKDTVVRAEGKSMGTVFDSYNEVLIRPLKRPPRIGEITVINQGNRFVIHRLIGYVRGHETRFMTKGDGNVKADDLVRAEDIIGLAVGIRREGKLWTPWHWKRPFSLLISVWLRVEATWWPLCNYPFRAVRLIQRILSPNNRRQKKQREN